MRKLLLSISFLFCISSFANAQSKQLEKAQKLFKEKRYTEAAKFYEIALEEKSTIGVKTKLAYCYRVNNKMDKAEILYAEIVQSEKAKSKSYFYYGETLMSNGKYDEAKKWFQEYTVLVPDDETAPLMIEACDLVKTIEPYFQKIETREFPFNSDADDSSPVMLGDNLVFSSDRASGIVKHKSGWTGRSYINLFFSSQNDTSFTEPKVFSGKLSESNKNTGNATFTEDGNEIFFTRNGVELSSRSVYNLSIFTAEATGDLRWKNVKPMPFSSKQYNFMHPAISPDGKDLYFVSDKPRGQGGTDIWVTHRTKDGWSRTENLGLKVNTAANEGFPFIDDSGKLYFCSKGHPGFGGFDIFVTEKNSSGEWTTPINLGSPINSPQDDISISLSKDKTKGLFTSNRSGGDDDIYLFEIIKGHSNNPKYATKQDEPKFIPVKENIPAEIKEEVSIEEEINSAVPEKILDKIIKAPTYTKQDKVEDEVEILADSLAKIDLTTDSDIEAIPDFYYMKESKMMAETGNLAKGQIFRLSDVHYDFEVYQVTPQVKVGLDQVVLFLNENENIQIELGAHTESPGNDKNNLILSRYRAEAALAYLVKQGINKERLTSKGYGETQILNKCVNGIECSSEEHTFNQRLEIKIMNN